MYSTFRKTKNNNFQAKLREEVFVPGVKKHLTFYSNYLKKNTSEFLVGDGVTFVDILLAGFMGFIETNAPEVLAEFPEVFFFKQLKD